MAREIAFCVLTTHSTGQDDGTPLRYVTDAQLARYQADQTELDTLKSTDAVRLVIWLRRHLARLYCRHESPRQNPAPQR